MVSYKPKFPAWREITLGGFRSSKELAAAVKKAGFQITNDAMRRLDTIEVAERKRKLTLVLTTPLSFGLQQTRCSEVFARAKACGLGFAPREAALQLRLQYSDQPRGEILHIATEPAPDGRPDLFFLKCFGSVKCLGSDFHEGDLWDQGSYWVFVQGSRKK